MVRRHQLHGGEPSGRPIYQVKLERRKHRVMKSLRRGPMDVEFYARVATKGIGHRPDSEKIVAVPVDKAWRPVVATSILVKLLANRCEERDLRYFPDSIRAKRRAGTLTLADLLAVGDSELRVYVFAYRRRAGTRWMIRRKYDPGAIKPGVFDGGRVAVPDDGLPPKRPDLEEAGGETADATAEVVRSPPATRIALTTKGFARAVIQLCRAASSAPLVRSYSRRASLRTLLDRDMRRGCRCCGVVTSPMNRSRLTARIRLPMLRRRHAVAWTSCAARFSSRADRRAKSSVARYIRRSKARRRGPTASHTGRSTCLTFSAQGLVAS